MHCDYDNGNEQDNLNKHKIPETASLNQEWSFHHDEKPDNMHKPKILTTAWIKRESITEGKICNPNEQEKLNEH